MKIHIVFVFWGLMGLMGFMGVMRGYSCRENFLRACVAEKRMTAEERMAAM
jgi:hypothetical protein